MVRASWHLERPGFSPADIYREHPGGSGAATAGLKAGRYR